MNHPAGRGPIHGPTDATPMAAACREWPMAVRVVASADVNARAGLGDGTSVWH